MDALTEPKSRRGIQYSVEFKREVLNALNYEKPMRVARKFNISPTTLYQWIGQAHSIMMSNAQELRTKIELLQHQLLMLQKENELLKQVVSHLIKGDAKS